MFLLLVLQDLWWCHSLIWLSYWLNLFPLYDYHSLCQLHEKNFTFPKDINSLSMIVWLQILILLIEIVKAVIKGLYFLSHQLHQDSWCQLNHAAISPSIFFGQSKSQTCFGGESHWLHLIPCQSSYRQEHGLFLL